MNDDSTYTEIGLRFPDGHETWPTDYGQDGSWIHPDPARGLIESIDMYYDTTPAQVAKIVEGIARVITRTVTTTFGPVDEFNATTGGDQ